VYIYLFMLNYVKLHMLRNIDDAKKNSPLARGISGSLLCLPERRILPAGSVR
jgi:hypothetical protein